MYKPEQARLTTGLSVGLLIIVILAVYLSQQVQLSEGLSAVLLVIAGITTMIAISALQRLIEGGIRPPEIHITFNQEAVQRTLSELPGVRGEVLEGRSRQPQAAAPWDINVAQLVGVDNALALAKLRMDLEAELRRLAYENEVSVQARPFGARALARELAAREVLPPRLVELLDDVISACNKAVHGFAIEDDAAASVVRTGVQIIETLRRLPVSHGGAGGPG